MSNIKVLVISANAFSKTLNNGKTLESIFSGFNRSDLSQLFFRPTAGNTYDYTYADSYYHLSDMDIIHSCSRFKKQCGRVIQHSSHHSEIASNSKYYKRIKNPTHSLKVILRDALWKIPVWKYGGLLEWAKSLSPNIIFAYLGGGRYMYDVVSFLSKKLNVPYVVFYGDDYILYSPKTTLFDKIQSLRSHHYYRIAIQGASRCFCIGELMAKEYSSYFGRSFFPIMNCVDIQEYMPIRTNNRIIISYLGGLHLNRWKMIRRVANNLPENTIIQVYSGTSLTPEMKEALSHPRIVLNGLVSSEDVKRIMLSSSILLHVESDEKEYRNYTHLSVSTKIPEYMMAGRLILGYGPTEVASMRLLSDYGLGIVISSECSESELETQLKSICSNPSVFDEYGHRAYEYAIAQFNKNSISSNFRKQLESTLSNN